MNGIVIEEFKSVPRNSLRGFARVRMPSGVVFHDVLICEKDGARFAVPPSKPLMGRDGKQIERNGKPQWQSMVSFASKEVRDRFSNAIIAAVEAAHPEAFRDD